jgi:hypothetical protein
MKTKFTNTLTFVRSKDKRQFYSLLAIMLILLSPFNIWAQNCFSYRAPITLTNLGSSALTDFQVSVTINTAALVAANKMQASGNDIRFRDANNNELSYWIESGMNTATTTIWVKVNNIAATGNTTIYLYYGDNLASAYSNGDATFLLFDDFLGNSLNTAKWTPIVSPTNASISVSGGNITFNATNSTMASIKSNAAFPSPIVSEMRVMSSTGVWANLYQFDNGTFNGYGMAQNSSTMLLGILCKF